MLGMLDGAKTAELFQQAQAVEITRLNIKTAWCSTFPSDQLCHQYIPSGYAFPSTSLLRNCFLGTR